jgi:diketogulonate reductase-like aldo/keto reductase
LYTLLLAAGDADNARALRLGDLPGGTADSSVRGEAPRERRADASVRPGDQCDLPLQSWRGYVRRRYDLTLARAPKTPGADMPRAGRRVLSERRCFASGIVGIEQSMSTQADQIPRLPLSPNEQIPQLGFGVFQVPPRETEEVVATALSVGYRHLDTAAAYRNEAAVGEAVRASGLDRAEIFITTKCWNDDQGYEQAKRACRASLERLELNHLDLYLIHWPVPAHDLYVETWKAFIELQSEGLVRSIGVSNFQPAHLERLIAETGVTPSINQVELHPYFQQVGLRREHERLGILTEAWSPLGQGLELADPTIVQIAEAHSKTAAQTIIRWHLQLGNVVIPKSVTPARIRENFEVFDFELSDGEMAAIETLDEGRRMGPEPDTFVRP